MASSGAAAGTHNTEGINVDLYIPRKWCAVDRHACSRREAPPVA